MEGRTFTHYSRDEDRTELTYHGGIGSDSYPWYSNLCLYYRGDKE